MWIEKLANGKYKYIERYTDPYTEKERRVSIRLTSNSNQARNKAARILNEKIEQKLHQKKDSNLTFGIALTEWFDYYIKTTKRSTAYTGRGILKIVKHYVNDDILIKNIDSFFIQSVIEKAYYDDGYSLNYVKKIKSFIIATLKRAHEKGDLAEIPYYKIKLNLRQEKKADKYLSSEELNAIIKHLRMNPLNDRKADMVKFLALTGLRYGELVALKTSNILDQSISIDGTIHFHSTTYDSPIRTTPKTQAANRIVPLPTEAVAILKKVQNENTFLMQNKSYKDQEYIFTRPNGLPIDYRTFSPVLRKAAINAGIMKPVTTHYLRHTHVSLLAELNVPIKVVMERIGHSDAAMTLEVYSHVSKTMTENLLDKLNTIKLD